MGKQAMLPTPGVQSIAAQTMGFMQCHELFMGVPVLGAPLFCRCKSSLVHQGTFEPILGRVVVDVQIGCNGLHRAVSSGEQLDYCLFNKCLGIFWFHRCLGF